MKLGQMAFPALAALLSASLLDAQQPTAAAPPASPPLPVPEVGSMAPDFEFTPVTMGGVQKPTKLSALKGQTTVIWFFFKARTRG